ncbi:MAG: hypothetical protein P8O08_17580, partial [Paracoccaceae bacterium]|nr:hypothetical protein [Paracoccaceae bacterium]
MASDNLNRSLPHRWDAATPCLGLWVILFKVAMARCKCPGDAMVGLMQQLPAPAFPTVRRAGPCDVWAPIFITATIFAAGWGDPSLWAFLETERSPGCCPGKAFIY